MYMYGAHTHTHTHTHSEESSLKRQQAGSTRVAFGRESFTERGKCSGSQTRMPGRNTSESLEMER